MAQRFQTFQSYRYLLFLILVLGTLIPHAGYSWGARGHALVCESAIHLVKNENLKHFLMTKMQGLSYLCNLPDTYWRGLPEASIGGPTHFFETDIVGMTFDEIPPNASFADVEKMVKGKINTHQNRPLQEASREMGSSWWRAEQFVRLATEAGKKGKKKVKLERDDDDLYTMWIMMGLLGHFVGDNAQPFHTTKNYDGWDTGNGGIHSYYENELVNQLPAEALVDVIRASSDAQKELPLAPTKGTVELMRALAILSHKDIKILLSKDPVTKPSKVYLPKGMEIKTEAQRKSPLLAMKAFQPHLVSHLSRGASLLAQLWDKIYLDAGEPRLDKNQSYRFPHQFPFVAPDYLSSK